MARVGILVECGPYGMEFHVCRKICALLARENGIVIEPEIIPMGNKPRLIEECALVAQTLFDQGCERVVILWDERPAWPDRKRPLCLVHERDGILEVLRAAHLEGRPVSLVCIQREFESWLLHDHVLLSAVLSRDGHKVRVPPQRRPDRIDNPKGRMKNLIEQHIRKYVEVEYAPRFAKSLENLDRLRKCPTFCRFVEGVVGRPP